MSNNANIIPLEPDKAYLGKYAQDLLNLSSAQVADIYRQNEIIIPVVVTSVLQLISENPTISSADLASTLDIPHQLVSQRIKKLDKLELVKKTFDKNDLRKQQLKLTAEGKKQALKVNRAMGTMAEIYSALNEELNCDLQQMLKNAIKALNSNPLMERYHLIQNQEKP